MAIDTAEKRNSAMQTPGEMPWIPTGEIVASSRLPMLEFYSGFVADDGVVDYLQGFFWCEPFFGGTITAVEFFGGRVMAN